MIIQINEQIFGNSNETVKEICFTWSNHKIHVACFMFGQMSTKYLLKFFLKLTVKTTNLPFLFCEMAAVSDFFSIGSVVWCRTCYDKDVEGEVLAFDPQTKILILSILLSTCPSLVFTHLLLWFATFDVCIVYNDFYNEKWICFNTFRIYSNAFVSKRFIS